MNLMVGFFSGYSVFFVECHEDLIWIPFSGMCSLCISMVIIIFSHCERILIMSKSLLELSFQVFYDLLSIFTNCFLFLLSLNNCPLFYLLIQLLPQFATWFSLNLIASTCHHCVLIIYLWNASHKKKGITTTLKKFNDYYLLLQHCTEIYLYTL